MSSEAKEAVPERSYANENFSGPRSALGIVPLRFTKETKP